MSSDFKGRVQKWLMAPPPHLPARLYHGACSLYYRSLRQKAWNLVHFISHTGMASSAPIVGYATGALGGLAATTLFAALFAGHGAVTVIRRKTVERPVSGPRSATETVIRLGDMLSALTLKSNQPDRTEAIRAALGIIDILARDITGLERGQIAVSIAIYAGNSSHQMILKYRNPGNERPIGRSFDGEKTIGHWVCQAGAEPVPRIIDDLKRFGKGALKSPTRSQPDYRSILFLPLRIDRKGNSRPGGFLSVDATVPYAFHGGRGIELIVHAEPIIQQIQELL